MSANCDKCGRPFCPDVLTKSGASGHIRTEEYCHQDCVIPFDMDIFGRLGLGTRFKSWGKGALHGKVLIVTFKRSFTSQSRYTGSPLRKNPDYKIEKGIACFKTESPPHASGTITTFDGVKITML